MIARLLARLTPTTWLGAPRPTARLRLTVLYGTLFLLSGSVLLAVAYVLAARATVITLPRGTSAASGGTSTTPSGAPRTPSAAGASRTVHLAPSQTVHLQAQVTHLHDVAMHQLLIGSGVALAAMAVISIVLGWLVAGRVLRPVRTINAAARRIRASNLHERLSLDGPNDEFRELAATLDDLLDRLQASFDSQRRFVANASHELRTPLTLDRALLERALRKPEPTQAFWRATCERLFGLKPAARPPHRSAAHPCPQRRSPRTTRALRTRRHHRQHRSRPRTRHQEHGTADSDRHQPRAGHR